MNRHRPVTERVAFKFLVTLSLSFFVFAGVIISMMTIGVRNIGIESAKEDAVTVADVLLKQLNRDDFLYRLREDELKDYFAQVTTRHNIDFVRLSYLGDDHSKNVQKVFATQQQVLELVENLQQFLVAVHVPYFDEDGQVIGVISVSLNATDFRDRWMRVTNAFLLFMAFFFVMMFFVFKRLLSPYIALYYQLHTVVFKMQKGDFEQRLQTNLKDEIGDIARWINTTYKKIHDIITDIEQRIPLLIHYRQDIYDQNPLVRIKEVFDELIDVYYFKKQLESADSLKDAENIMINFFKTLNYERFSITEARRFESRLIYKSLALNSEHYYQIFNTNDLMSQVGTTSLELESVKDLKDDFFCVYTDEQKGYWINFKILNDLTWNILFIFDSKEQLFNFEKNIPFLSNCFNVIRTALQSRYLIDMFKENSQRDPLTQLYNRAFLEEFSKNATSQAKRLDANYAILMADIDFFKKINDSYGHNIGDKVLKRLAKSFLEVIRSSDLAVRYGGEEFLILLLNCDKKGALSVAQKIKNHFEAIVFESDESVSFSCTLSIGISLFPDDAKSIQLATKYADIALYEAKQRGRNQIVIFEPTMLPKDFNSTKI